MASKLNDNGVFEGSRMILPEHREAFLVQEREQQRRGRPALDEQAIEEITRALVQSYHEKVRVDLIVFNPFEDESVSGMVIGINKSKYSINLLLEEDEREIPIAEIIRAST